MTYKPPTTDPTPREIEQACAEIQQTWTAADFAIRAGRATDAADYQRTYWMPQTFSAAELTDER